MEKAWCTKCAYEVIQLTDEEVKNLKPIIEKGYALACGNCFNQTMTTEKPQKGELTNESLERKT